MSYHANTNSLSGWFRIDKRDCIDTLFHNFLIIGLYKLIFFIFLNYLKTTQEKNVHVFRRTKSIHFNGSVFKFRTFGLVNPANYHRF